MDQAISTMHQSDDPPLFINYASFAENLEGYFCAPDNIEASLQLVAQEYEALGYSSIFPPNKRPSQTLNCDIVSLLDGVFQLVADWKANKHARDDLISRNQSLVSDLNALNRKHSKLQESLEKSERRYNGSLEKERQLKLKLEELQQNLKSEKDESRKLTSQLQRQKDAYTHEVRKSEKAVEQMKSKVNKLMSVKSTERRILSNNQINVQQNSKKKAKGKSESDVTAEELCRSLISSNESKCLSLMKESEDLKGCLAFVYSELKNIDEIFHGEVEPSDVFSVDIFLDSHCTVQVLREKFQDLLHKIQKSAVEKMVQIQNFTPNMQFLLSKFAQSGYTKKRTNDNSSTFCDADIAFDIDGIEYQNNVTPQEQSELSNALMNIKREISVVEVEREQLKRWAVLRQENPKSRWYQNLPNVPSLSVIAAKSDDLQAHNTDLQDKNTDLQAKNTDLQAKNTDLQAKNTDLQSKNTDLQARDDKLEVLRSQQLLRSSANNINDEKISEMAFGSLNIESALPPEDSSKCQVPERSASAPISLNYESHSPQVPLTSAEFFSPTHLLPNWATRGSNDQHIFSLDENKDDAKETPKMPSKKM